MSSTPLQPESSLPASGNPNLIMFASKDQPRLALSDRLSASSDYGDKSFPQRHQYHHNASSTFCSNESSPTTTYSTADDSSVTEHSPDSSPESPPPAGFQMGVRPQSAEDEKQNAFFELQRIASPPRKGRNLKNLAVNTSRSTNQTSSLTGLPLDPQRHDSAPSILSPAFVKPPEPQKRRPSNLGLSILTPSHVNSSPKQIRLAIPPTPGLGKPLTLRHFQSSPSLPLLSGFNSKSGGLAQGNKAGILDTIFSPLNSLPKPNSQVIQEEEQTYDIPLSREDKPEAYPDGPICVYPPHIDLYLEPTAEQARQYDVVLNVASEVTNPFDAVRQPKQSEPQVRLDGGGGIQYAPDRRASPMQAHNEANGSPTTPKATPLSKAFPASIPSPRPGSEYIHIPWEHNSDIVPDLLWICKLIDDRVKEQKRVLVHCQCGVSRSASLVVAYGLYKNPTESVQEAYDAVKRKSKWIGPNMNLIMQLQEFRSSLARGGVLSGDRGLSPITPTSALSEWTGPFLDVAHNVGPHAAAMSARLPPSTSRSEHFDRSIKSPVVPLIDPWSAVLPAVRTRANSAVRGASTYVDPAGHVVPVLSIVEAPSITPKPVQSHSFVELTPEPLASNQQRREEEQQQQAEALPSPRATEFAMSALTPPRAVDSADFFGIMSPTSTEFKTNPFDRSALLAQLGMTQHTQQQQQQAAPTRTRSLKSNKATKASSVNESDSLTAPRRLRGKISSPTLREQHQLQNLQAQLEAQLARRQAIEEAAEPDATLMSPRATEFTQNPFALAFDMPNKFASSSTDTAIIDKTPAADPRSPAHKGASPIIRNIEDFL